MIKFSMEKVLLLHQLIAEATGGSKRILLSEGIRYNHRKTSYRLLQVFYYHLGDDSFGFFFSSS